MNYYSCKDSLPEKSKGQTISATEMQRWWDRPSDLNQGLMMLVTLFHVGVLTAKDYLPMSEGEFLENLSIELFLSV